MLVIVISVVINHRNPTRGLDAYSREATRPNKNMKHGRAAL
jgi:hypothetical protein